MSKLILLRHFKSQWNMENRFTGWVDAPLLKERSDSDKETAEKIAAFDFDVAYTSPLIRNMNTVLEVFERKERKYPIFRRFEGKMKTWGEFTEINDDYIPVYVTEALNERYYGKLQGLNKEETIKKYGQTQVRLWRRDYRALPPGGESLADTVKRTTPFYRKYIENDLKQGKNILVTASHNSLRVLVKHIESISDKEIINFEIPYGGWLEYEFGEGVYKKLN